MRTFVQKSEKAECFLRPFFLLNTNPVSKMAYDVALGQFLLFSEIASKNHEIYDQIMNIGSDTAYNMSFYMFSGSRNRFLQ